VDPSSNNPPASLQLVLCREKELSPQDSLFHGIHRQAHKTWSPMCNPLKKHVCGYLHPIMLALYSSLSSTDNKVARIIIQKRKEIGMYPRALEEAKRQKAMQGEPSRYVLSPFAGLSIHRIAIQMPPGHLAELMRILSQRSGS